MADWLWIFWVWWDKRGEISQSAGVIIRIYGVTIYIYHIHMNLSIEKCNLFKRKAESLYSKIIDKACGIMYSTVAFAQVK